MYELKPNSFFNQDNSKDELNHNNMETKLKDNFCYLGEYFYAEYSNQVEEAPEELREFIREINGLHDRLGIEPKSQHEVLDKINPKFESAPKQETYQEAQPVVEQNVVQEEKENLVSETVAEEPALRKFPTCGAEVDSSFAFCTSCGCIMPADVEEIPKAEIQTDIHEGLRKCPTCGEFVDASFMFCTACGSKMPEEAEKPKEETLQEDITPVVEPELIEDAAIEPEVTPVSSKIQMNEGMRKCPTCGAEVDSLFAFCTSCGCKMPAEELKEEVIQETPIEAEAEAIIEPEPVEEPAIEPTPEVEPVAVEIIPQSIKVDRNPGMRTCPSCGETVKSSVKFCTSCGFKMPEEEMKEEAQQVEELQEKLEREIKTEPEITMDSKTMEELQEKVERKVQEEPVIFEDTSATEPKAEEKRTPLFCVQCGNKIRPGARFCTECGRKIR